MTRPALSILFALAGMSCASCFAQDNNLPVWEDKGELQRAIATADRLVVRPGGARQGLPGVPDKQHFEVADEAQVREVASHIEFVSPQKLSSCFCYGSITLDWFEGERRLACMSIKHGAKISWTGDYRMTDESADWIANWLAERGQTIARDQLDDTRLHDATKKAALPILARFTPDGLNWAHKRAIAAEEVAYEEADPEVVATSGELLYVREKAFRQYIAEEYPERDQRYRMLFRLMGCLTMEWHGGYEMQHEVSEMLDGCPAHELHRALQLAAQSNDEAERQGAARVVFMTLSGIEDEYTPSDINTWLSMFAEIAYANPLPENRRSVVNRLEEYAQALANGVLDQALSDPDQTVRRLAIDAIAERDPVWAASLLTKMKEGKITPRPAPEQLPTDYAKGTSMSYGSFIKAGEYSDSDWHAAEVALLKLNWKLREP
ncbi:hypothetical protein [Aeoliella sp.]|uniref:hypothetical protein n=1 Tax=Aeoliella sp. TaxID=2795800 RepID=UPI003CCB7C87